MTVMAAQLYGWIVALRAMLIVTGPVAARAMSGAAARIAGSVTAGTAARQAAPQADSDVGDAMVGRGARELPLWRWWPCGGQVRGTQTRQ